jgi:hypothetical protein
MESLQCDGIERIDADRKHGTRRSARDRREQGSATAREGQAAGGRSGGAVTSEGVLIRRGIA